MPVPEKVNCEGESNTEQFPARIVFPGIIANKQRRIARHFKKRMDPTIKTEKGRNGERRPTGSNAFWRRSQHEFSMGESSTPNFDFRGLVPGTIEQLRAKLLDLTMANRSLNFKLSEKAKSHVAALRSQLFQQPHLVVRRQALDSLIGRE